MSKAYAQQTSKISFEINQQLFTINVSFTSNQKPVVAFFRYSLQIKTDTLFLGETSLCFRVFDKDTLLNINIIENKIEDKNNVYSN